MEEVKFCVSSLVFIKAGSFCFLVHGALSCQVASPSRGRAHAGAMKVRHRSEEAIVDMRPAEPPDDHMTVSQKTDFKGKTPARLPELSALCCCKLPLEYCVTWPLTAQTVPGVSAQNRSQSDL